MAANDKPKTLKIEFTRNTFIRGELAEPGDVLEIDTADAEYVCRIGKAKLAGQNAKVGKAPKKEEPKR